MAYTISPVLGMQLPDPLTIQAFETTVVNSDFLAIDTAIGADRTRLTALELYVEADLADLNALSSYNATNMEGRTVFIKSMGVDFQARSGVWVQTGVAIFATAAARDTEYAKASGAYLVQGAKSARTDFMQGSVTWQYYGLYNSSTNPGGATPAGWYPVPGSDIRADWTMSSGGVTSGGAYPMFSGTIVTGRNDFFAIVSNAVQPPTPGDYEVVHSTTWTTLNGTNERRTALTLSGATLLSGENPQALIPSATIPNLSSQQVAHLRMPAGSNVQPYILQNSGSTLSATESFGIRYLGPTH